VFFHVKTLMAAEIAQMGFALPVGVKSQSSTMSACVRIKANR
jgi:hypothetical protein